MDVSGLYEVTGEVFILPLEGGGSFTSSMAALSATGRSKVLEDEERRLRVDNFDIDFTIGQVFIQMNNLFNGENQLLADTVNKFLNDHSQEVIKEVGVFEENVFTVLKERANSFNLITRSSSVFNRITLWRCESCIVPVLGRPYFNNRGAGVKFHDGLPA